LRRKLEGHQGRIGSMSRSPNGNHLVSSSGADIRVWEIDTGKEIFKSFLPGFGKFSADGNSLLIALDGTTIRKVSLQGVVEAELQKVGGAIETFAVTAAAPFLVATGDDGVGHVQFWDMRGQFVQNVGKHASRVWSVRFAPDGQRLASASRDGTICIWDARPQPALRRLTLPNPQAIYCATLSRDGKHLYLGNRDNRLRCWDVPSARQVGEWELPVESPPALALMPDQQTIVFTGGRRPHVTTGLLDLQDSTVQKLTSLSGGMTRRAGDWLAVSPDGSVLALHQSTIRVADHDDDIVASSAELFSISEMRPLGTLATNKGPPAVPPTVAFHPFRPILAVGGVDCPTFLYDYQRAQVTTRSPQFHVTALAFSTDGSLLALGTHDGCVRLLDGTTLAETAVLDISSYVIIRQLVFSPDGRTLAGAAVDGIIRLWNIATGKVVLTHPIVDNAITAVFFTPDGRTLIIGAGNSSTEEGELLFLYAQRAEIPDDPAERPPE
jgi:WD40 repeat protein